MPRQLTDRGEERRRQLIEIATTRFAEKGYHQTSVAEIVEGLGVGKGVFYWYFSSKEELFRAILRDAQLDLRRTQRAALQDAADPLARIVAGIRASVLWSHEHRELERLVEFAAIDVRFAAAIRKGEQTVVNDAARHVADAIEAGLIPESDPESLARAMFGVATALTRRHLRDGIPSVEETAETTVRFCLGGLAGDPAKFSGPLNESRS